VRSRSSARPRTRFADLPSWEAFEPAAALRRVRPNQRAIYEELNKDSEMFRTAREAMYDAGQPLFDQAQNSGTIRPDTSFDDVLRMVSGLTAAAS